LRDEGLLRPSFCAPLNPCEFVGMPRVPATFSPLSSPRSSQPISLGLSPCLPSPLCHHVHLPLASPPRGRSSSGPVRRSYDRCYLCSPTSSDHVEPCWLMWPPSADLCMQSRLVTSSSQQPGNLHSFTLCASIFCFGPIGSPDHPFLKSEQRDNGVGSLEEASLVHLNMLPLCLQGGEQNEGPAAVVSRFTLAQSLFASYLPYYCNHFGELPVIFLFIEF